MQTPEFPLGGTELLPPIQPKPLERGHVQVSREGVVADQQLPTGFAGPQIGVSGVARECGAWSNLEMQFK
jgi:hypothetical protein